MVLGNESTENRKGNNPEMWLRHSQCLFNTDSALGSCKLARNGNTQAIMPIRGKILNCLKANLLKIAKSEPIMDLIKVLGCGIEIKDKALKDVATFDINKLRWNKIIICTDADVDGMQIRTLVITMLYRLCPTLLKMGKVYIAETPLFEITHTLNKKVTTHFAYTDQERDEIVAKLNLLGGKINIQRSKGLGENDPEMMSLTTMAPATRKLTQIIYTEDQLTYEYFDKLLGDNLKGRKESIVDYAVTHANEDFDIA